MKSIILFITLSSAICISCSNKRQQLQPEATPDKEPAITGGNDTATNIRISSQDTLPDKDTIVYDIPECCLWYAKDLRFHVGGTCCILGECARRQYICIKSNERTTIIREVLGHRCLEGREMGFPGNESFLHNMA